MIWAALAWLRSTWLGKALAGAVATLALLFVVHKRGEAEGRKETLEDLTDADKRRAEALRRRVDAARAAGGGLHDDNRGYRD